MPFTLGVGLLSRVFGAFGGQDWRSVALAAGVASFASGYEVGLIVVAATSIGGAFIASITLTPAAAKVGGSGGFRKHGIQPDSIFPKPGRHP